MTEAQRAPFDPRAYLEEYFTQTDVEYEGLYRFWIDVARALPADLRVLELGVGPTLYSSLPFAERARELWLADYVRGSLVEINKWVENHPDCFDWSLHIRLVLQLEGREGTSAEVEARAAVLRQAIRCVTICDFLQPLPLGSPDLFDLVTAHYCTEAATASPEEWTSAVGHIARHVTPGGWLLLSVSTGLSIFRDYDPARPARPSPTVTAALIDDALAQLGLREVRRELLPAPAGRPYHATHLVLAQSPHR